MADNFCLEWKDYKANVSSAFQELRAESNFFDVTLGCSDVDTPRSESDLKQHSEEDTAQAKETTSPSPDPSMEEKKLASMSRESYGVDNMIKFGNA